MATTALQNEKLRALLAPAECHGSIPLPYVFAPPSIFEPPPDFPATLMRSKHYSNSVTEALETKVQDLQPLERKETYLREIGYVGCWLKNVAYLCKKDAPVLQPLEIRVESEIRFLKAIYFLETPREQPSHHQIFLAVITFSQMHCYEACPIEHEEMNFTPSFSVEHPSGNPLTAIVSTKCRRVFCGLEKGGVCELRRDIKGNHPIWITVSEMDTDIQSVTSLCLDETKGLVYALHASSAVDVFSYRGNYGALEVTRRVTGYRPEPTSHVALTDLFPLPCWDPNLAYLLAASSDGFLFSFQLDFRKQRRSLPFVRKIFRSTPPVASLQLTHESSCIATWLRAEENLHRKLLGIGFFEGLVMAVEQTTEDGESIDLYSVTRLPTHQDDISDDAANVVFIKEPIHLTNFISIHPAADDDNTRLFEGLDIGQDELSRQVFLKGHKMVVLTGSTALDLRRRCPVEVLMETLQVHIPKRLDEFFLLYGAIETATMAVQLAAARGDEHARRLLLDNHRLGAMYFSTEIHNPGEISIAARAILCYFRRLLAPIWNRHLFRYIPVPRRKDVVKVESNLTLPQLEWFVQSMKELGGFVDGYLREFEAVRFLDGSVFVPKCPTLLPEFELLFDVRHLIIRSEEFLSLMKITEESKPVYLPDHSHRQMEGRNFSDFVFDPAFPSTNISDLIASILRKKETEVQEAIIFKMDNEMPQLRQTKDRIFEKALALLKKAKTSPRPERQEVLVSKALNLLGDGCEERHIDDIMTALTELQRHYEVLHFASITAKKLVPEPITSDPTVNEKARHMRRHCYEHVFKYIEDYVQKIDLEDEDSTDVPVLYGAVHCLNDSEMMSLMMEKLISLDKIPKKTMHLMSFYEFGMALRNHLTQKNIKAANIHKDMRLGETPMTGTVEKEVRLLVEVCQAQGDLKRAGDWLMVLARRVAEKQWSVPLIERIGDLNDARAMYETVMPENFLREVERIIEVAMFQQRLLTIGKRYFTARGDAVAYGHVTDTKDISIKLVDPETLYKVIQDYFPVKISQDLTMELQRITGELGETGSGDDTMIFT